MNIYARYFDRDILVYSIEELIDFLSSIPDIHVTEELVADIRNYVESDMPYFPYVADWRKFHLMFVCNSYYFHSDMFFIYGKSTRFVKP